MDKTLIRWDDYELLDSGGFEKLERYGQYVLRRPEPQALWPKRLPETTWKELPDAWFKNSKSDHSPEGGERGEWVCKRGMPDRWTVEYSVDGKALSFRLGMTAFKHIGIFPEQAENWRFIYDSVTDSTVQEPKVLNLFAYTGGASLAAAAAGAVVTHVDSVKPVVSWARENADASGIQTIRWIVEDALKYVLRETRRGSTYQGIILDPPAYGRGPAGEKWILEDQITVLLEACAQLLEKGGFVVLNLYSMGFSPIIAANLLNHYFKRPMESIGYGELTVTDQAGRILPLSVYARFPK
jgi:23S rRNA (cytosine1962-C5)-methyltransferase